MPECYIRGNTIKYLRIPDEVIDMVKEDAQAKSRNRAELSKGRGGNAQSQGGSNQRGGGGGGGGGGNRGGGNRGNYHKGTVGSSGNGPSRSNPGNNQRLMVQSNQKRK